MSLVKSSNELTRIKKILFVLSDVRVICHKCNNELYFYNSSIDDFMKVCKYCKTKIPITSNTIFHNVRFGLDNAFKICIDLYNSNYTFTSVDISKKYNITQKSAWHFSNKVKINKEYIKTLNDYNIMDKKDFENHLKMKRYIIKNRLNCL
jgi:hypothetical protein